jgi:hypothetical protein
LAFARCQPLRSVAVDVNAVVAETSRLLRTSLGVETEIASMLADDVPPALADPAQLSAAIVSLAIAAHNAMMGGGKLTIRTRSYRIEPSVAGVAKREASVAIAVLACGDDVADTRRGRIFGDIAMAEDFVIQSGGRIKVARQPPGVRWPKSRCPARDSRQSAALLRNVQSMAPSTVPTSVKRLRARASA